MENYEDYTFETSKYGEAYKEGSKKEAFLQEIAQENLIKDDKHDCIVKALSKILDIPYLRMSLLCDTILLRTPKKPLNYRRFERVLEARHFKIQFDNKKVKFKIINIEKYYTKYKVDGKSKISYVPFYKLAKKYRRGSYIITNPHHAAAMIKGKLVDEDNIFNEHTGIKRLIKLTF